MVCVLGRLLRLLQSLTYRSPLRPAITVARPLVKITERRHNLPHTTPHSPHSPIPNDGHLSSVEGSNDDWEDDDEDLEDSNNGCQDDDESSGQKSDGMLLNKIDLRTSSFIPTHSLLTEGLRKKEEEEGEPAKTSKPVQPKFSFREEELDGLLQGLSIPEDEISREAIPHPIDGVKLKKSITSSTADLYNSYFKDIDRDYYMSEW
jgi:hypothetical protein